MRDRMERFVVLPFSVGCMSDSSVAVAAALSPSPRRSKPVSDSSPHENPEDDEENMKNAFFKFHALSKPEMPTSIHRLFKSFKTISHIFAYKEEMEEYEETSGMEIGLPTDVKHVSHIGWESPIMTTAAKSGEGFEHLIPPELLPHHHHHHHFPMLPAAAQQDHHLHSALLNPSS